jgi:hypothetical protein
MISGGIFAPVSVLREFINIHICEFGGMYTLFPLPILFVTYMMVKERKLDVLSTIVIIYSIVIGSYVFIGWPEWLARITLMSYSVSQRALDVLLFSQVFLLFRAMSWKKLSAEVNNETVDTKKLASAVAAGVIFMYIIERFSRITFTASLGFNYMMLSMLGITAIVYSIIDRQRNQSVFKAACLYMVVISTITLLSVHPVMKGLDAIYSKPLSTKITELAIDPDEKWLSEQGIVGSSFLIANGASTISSVNIYPNLELWQKLNPDGTYEYIYNRFALLSASLTTDDTSFELLAGDHIQLNLSYRDLEKASVRFIHTQRQLHDTDGVSFTLLYDEYDARIYSVSYGG